VLFVLVVEAVDIKCPYRLGSNLMVVVVVDLDGKIIFL